MSLVLNMPEFWIYQDFEYASCLEYAWILNMQGLLRFQNIPEHP